MKKRTVSQRNFIGALLGGILGILACGYLHTILLPFGCFFGVIIGWWHQEIYQSVLNAVRQSIIRLRESWNRFIVFILTPRRKLQEIKLKVKFDLSPWLKFIHAVLFSIVWLIRSPVIFVRWFKAHPMNRAYLARAFAVAVYTILNALWIIPLVIRWWKAFEAMAGNESSVMPLVYLLGIIFIVIIPAVAPSMFLSKMESSSMKRFYRDWERYAKCRLLGFFLRDLVKFFLCETSMILFLSGILFWFAAIGGIFVFLVVVPISAIVGLIKGIYRVTIRAGHWLCFGVTVVVTGFSAWLTHPYFNDARILWVVAILTGCVSGVVTEGVRRSLAWLFNVSKKMHRTAVASLHEQLTPSGRLFWRITVKVGEKFSEALPAFNLD